MECRGGRKYVKAYIRIGQVRHVEKEFPLNTDLIYLRIEGDYNYYHLSYSEDNHRFLPLGKMEYRFLAQRPSEDLPESFRAFCAAGKR